MNESLSSSPLAASVGLPVLVSLAWLAFVRRFDRTRPEPRWLVLATFALGGAMVLPAVGLERALTAAFPWLDSTSVARGGSLGRLPLTVAALTLSAGLIEEGAKWFAVWTFAARRREFDEPVDGIVYACASALGFAAIENVANFAFGRMSSAVVAVRAFVTVPAHMFFASLWGYAMGRRLVTGKDRTPGMLGVAAVSHGLFDAFLATDGLAFAAIALELVLGSAFAMCTARALRRGALGDYAGGGDAEEIPLSRVARSYYAMGSKFAFVACAAGMVVSALSLTVFATAYDFQHHRVSWAFVLVATALLMAFAGAAYGVSATIPLDAALDARGVTFAGRCTPWSSVAHASLEPVGRLRSLVRVVLRDGTCVIIGPTVHSRARELSLAIAARVESSRRA